MLLHIYSQDVSSWCLLEVTRATRSSATIMTIIVNEKRPIRASFCPQAMRTFHIIMTGIDRTDAKLAVHSCRHTGIHTHGIGDNIRGGLIMESVFRKDLLVRV